MINRSQAYILRPYSRIALSHGGTVVDHLLTIYKTSKHSPTIRPAEKKREWMDNASDRLPYLCLPMTMANQFGWEILTQRSFTATWDGGIEKDSITIVAGDGRGPLPISHFGSGILTFHVTYLFVTSPGHNLYIRGPVNTGKDGLVPLEGFIETEWLPNVFTMNYRFLRPHHSVSFEKGEPFCCFFPFPRHYLESFEPIMQKLESNPELEARYREWCRIRQEDKRERYPQGVKARRKDYLNGCPVSGPPFSNHQKVLQCKSVVDVSSKETITQEP